ncbi:hypothetical protein OUZ56_031353 [Daphnia magna]|uniref:Secreted protein n=1 Tax=Daphnia magna TaxID=35525 RepID=A0ABQ9ZTZ4_9CRUS|nr:hypothetical protein OUZ56_031353 [Daphnia magna]
MRRIFSLLMSIGRTAQGQAVGELGKRFISGRRSFFFFLFFFRISFVLLPFNIRTARAYFEKHVVIRQVYYAPQIKKYEHHIECDCGECKTRGSGQQWPYLAATKGEHSRRSTRKEKKDTDV